MTLSPVVCSSRRPALGPGLLCMEVQRETRIIRRRKRSIGKREREREGGSKQSCPMGSSSMPPHGGQNNIKGKSRRHGRRGREVVGEARHDVGVREGKSRGVGRRCVVASS